MTVTRNQIDVIHFSVILRTSKREEANIDELVKGLLRIHGEFSVDASVLQAHQHLIQFVTNLALHVLASVPEYKHRPGPGVSYFSLSFEFAYFFFFYFVLHSKLRANLKKSYSQINRLPQMKGYPRLCRSEISRVRNPKK